MKSSEIAQYLGKELFGEDIEVLLFSSLSGIVSNSVVFAKLFSLGNAELLNGANALALVGQSFEGKLLCPHIIVDNPRLAFIRVVQHFFPVCDIPCNIHHSAVVEKGAILGKNVSIGAHSYVGPRVSIGANSIIMPNVCIYGKVTIGEKCYIKSGSVIGGPGFGFEYDEKGVPIQFPHTGDVVIGNNVYIGANTTIDRATIDSTIIEDNVKIDNNVLIGHNCHIKENVIIVGGCVICGGVVVESNAWIAPNSSIHQKLKVGKKSKVGMGSVVLTNVRDETTVFGVPATKLVIGHKKK